MTTPKQRSNAWQTAATVLQEATPPDVARGFARDDHRRGVPFR